MDQQAQAQEGNDPIAGYTTDKRQSRVARIAKLFNGWGGGNILDGAECFSGDSTEIRIILGNRPSDP